MRFKKAFTAAIILIVGLLSGCSEQPPDSSIKEPIPKPVSLTGDDVVLARVNGTTITRYDLDQAIETMLDEASRSALDAPGRRKILESLVAGRAIAQARMIDLTSKDKAALERKVAAYREEILVKQYLTRHVVPEPVTPEMVESHYRAHPEQYGGKSIRTYEMIAGSRALSDQERDSLITAMKNPDQETDWRKWAETLRKDGLPVEYRTGQVDEEVLHPQLRNLLQPLEKGGPSGMGFIKGSAYLVRITDERKIPPQPLSEVSFQIRKSLAPVKLKESVRKASEEVLKTADVEYME